MKRFEKIFFIEAKSPGAHIFSKHPLPRLGAILLATILKEKGYNTRVYIEDIANPDWKELENADLLCISTITSTAPRAYEILEWAKKKNIPTVMGGAHPSFLPNEALEKGVDFVVRGEGEEALIKLVDRLNGNFSLWDVKGLSYKNGFGFHHNPDGELIQNLNSAPIPDFNLVHKWKSARFIPVATSRGCPFACRFCSVILVFGRQYRFKSVAKVLEEIRAAVSQNPKAHIFFVDDNFAANKERTKELLRAIINEKIKICWSAQVRTDIAKDPELVDLMVRAGCEVVQIGFESISPETLLSYEKKQKIGDIIDCIEVLKAHRIKIHGMFVLGADTDTVKTISETADFAIKYEIDSIQFLMLTPLPGTPVFDELKKEGRLIHTDWKKYDAHHAVFLPKQMMPEELHVETLKAMARVYSNKYIAKHIVRMIKYAPTFNFRKMKREFIYAGIGIYGKKATREALKKARGYFETMFQKKKKTINIAE